MATSSMSWPKKVALARISTSRNAEIDWSGIAANFSTRWARIGEWTSRTGTANTSRQARLSNRRSTRAGRLARRRPTTWSQ
jgi:hypothetical protein